jgi:hypothetical protein
MSPKAAMSQQSQTLPTGISAGEAAWRADHIERRRDIGDNDAEVLPPPKVGYCHPPAHSRFKPGQSGNPSGRAKGSQNFKTLFNKILNEEISLREGSDVKKLSKAEAIVRSVVIGALKGDSRNTAILFRLAEQVGQFEEDPRDITRIERVIVRWQSPDEKTEDDA